MNVSNGLFLIPMELSDDSSSNKRDSIISRVGVNRRLLTSPLYWELPKKVMHCNYTHPMYIIMWSCCIDLIKCVLFLFIFIRHSFLGTEYFLTMAS